jgi:hypothetical protein
MPDHRTFREHTDFQPAVRNSCTRKTMVIALFHRPHICLQWIESGLFALNDKRTFWHQQPNTFVPWLWLHLTAFSLRRWSGVVTNKRGIRESNRHHICTSIPQQNSQSSWKITYISQLLSLVRITRLAYDKQNDRHYCICAAPAKGKLWSQRFRFTLKATWRYLSIHVKQSSVPSFNQLVLLRGEHRKHRQIEN